MTTKSKGAARAVADVTKGMILATVEIAVAPERLFSALTTQEVTKWWGSDEDYRTTEWTADVKVGGSGEPTVATRAAHRSRPGESTWRSTRRESSCRPGSPLGTAAT